jgi:Ni,Fe-hydrogenase I cytochrome b subunit
VLYLLIKLYVADSTAAVPEGSNPVDVAALVKYYLASLPEPLTTLELYNEIKGARTNIYSMRNILKRLSSVNYMTLEFITALLLRASQKSLLNKVSDFCK